MTPAQLQALMDVHTDLHNPKPDKPKVSENPAADLAMLSAFKVA
jgi:hypothetical protein